MLALSWKVLSMMTRNVPQQNEQQIVRGHDSVHFSPRQNSKNYDLK
jgi:hypothetical protein